VLVCLAVEAHVQHGYRPDELSRGAGLAAPHPPDQAVPDSTAKAAAPSPASPAVLLRRAGVSLHAVGEPTDGPAAHRHVLSDGGMPLGQTSGAGRRATKPALQPGSHEIATFCVCGAPITQSVYATGWKQVDAVLVHIAQELGLSATAIGTAHCAVLPMR
jgi:hypothetical protein